MSGGETVIIYHKQLAGRQGPKSSSEQQNQQIPLKIWHHFILLGLDVALELIGQALSDRLDVAEGGLAGASAQQPDDQDDAVRKV